MEPRSTLTSAYYLIIGYVAISLASVGVAAGRSGQANSNALVHTVIVAISAVVLFLVTRRARGGSSAAFLRLRIISAVLVVAIVVIDVMPGSFPLWVKAEQTACGLLLLAVVAVVNRRTVRAGFGKSRGWPAFTDRRDSHRRAAGR